MPPISVTSLDDPRLDPYRDLKRSNRTRRRGMFVVEGHRVVRRLLDSPFPVESIVVSERRRDFLAEVVPEHVPLLVLPQELAAELVGYNFHHGVMACGRRLPQPELHDLLPAGCGPVLFVACPRMTDPDNMGGLIRLCAGFGVRGLLLGDSCSDPFSRRVLRVSMGTAFQLPILEFTGSGNECGSHQPEAQARGTSPVPSLALRANVTGEKHTLAERLEELRQEHGFRLLATVLDDTATPLADVPAIERLVLLLGNEADGLDQEWIDQCDQCVTIPMAQGMDSLNVTVAAGIFLHYFRFQARP
jgi:tRNA G18 (ribose-2'-O)-methylase SpoU